MFWALTLEPGQQYIRTFDCSFHVSMAAMESKSKLNAGITQVKVQRGVSVYVLCTLVHGSLYQQSLDLTFGGGEEIAFHTDGKATIYLTGYFLPTQLSVWGDQSQSLQFHNNPDSLPVDVEESVNAVETCPREGMQQVVMENCATDRVPAKAEFEEQKSLRESISSVLHHLPESELPTPESPPNKEDNCDVSRTPPNYNNIIIKEGISINQVLADQSSNSRNGAVQPIKSVPTPTAVYKSGHNRRSPVCVSMEEEDESSRWIDLNSSMACDKEIQEVYPKTKNQTPSRDKVGNTPCDGVTPRSSNARKKRNIKNNPRKRTLLECRICCKGFQSEGALVSHKCLIKSLKCRFCNKLYASKKGLMGHENNHMGLKPYKCRHCDEAFASTVFRSSHERFHTGKSIYRCKYCSKICVGTEKLQKHENIHQGLRPFKCDKCDKAYTIQRDLKKHTEEKHYSLKLLDIYQEDSK